jgi:hypothetical protein
MAKDFIDRAHVIIIESPSPPRTFFRITERAGRWRRCSTLQGSTSHHLQAWTRIEFGASFILAMVQTEGRFDGK